MDANRHNATVFVVGDTLWRFQAALVASSTVLTVFLKDCGAGPRMIAAIPAIETGGILLLGFCGLHLFASRAHRKRRVILWHAFGAVPFLFVISLLAAVGGRLSPPVLRWGVLLAFAGYVAALGVVVPAWVDWFGDVVSIRLRGTVMGLAACGAAVTGTIGGLAAGHLLSVAPVATANARLYLAAGLIALVAMGAFCFIRDPGAAATEEVVPPKLGAVLGSIRSSIGDRDYVRFLVGRMLAIAGFSMAPFIAVHYTSPAGGGLSDGTVVSYGAAIVVGSAVANLTLGRVGDKHGHRLGLIVGVAAQVVALAVLLAVPGAAGCLVAYALTGVSAGSNSVSHYNVLLESCRHDNRPAHIAIGNLSIGIVAVAAPLAGGAAVACWGVPRLFLLCLLVSGVALAWYLLMMREPRRVPTGPSGP